jgi:urease accessory protein UreH
VYVLHPPGGVVSGDQLRIRGSVEAGAHALITTPAANKLYRARDDRRASVHSTLQVGRGAVLEWLPQETIAFSGARAELSLRVDLEPEARFLGWEIVCLGRPAAGERFTSGALALTLELSRAGKPEYLERGSYEAGAPLLQAPWGLAGQPVVGTMLCATPGASAHVALAREALQDHGSTYEAAAENGPIAAGSASISAQGSPISTRAVVAPETAAEGGERGAGSIESESVLHRGEWAAPGHAWVAQPASAWPVPVAVSGWDDYLVARYLGPSAEQARKLFAALWAALRPAAIGCSACPPRIWHT